jgi:hypothetical protein
MGSMTRRWGRHFVAVVATLATVVGMLPASPSVSGQVLATPTAVGLPIASITPLATVPSTSPVAAPPATAAGASTPLPGTAMPPANPITLVTTPAPTGSPQAAPSVSTAAGAPSGTPVATVTPGPMATASGLATAIGAVRRRPGWHSRCPHPPDAVRQNCIRNRCEPHMRTDARRRRVVLGLQRPRSVGRRHDDASIAAGAGGR